MTAPTEAEIRQALEARLEQMFGTARFSIDDNPVREVLQPISDSEDARVRIGWSPEFFPSADHAGTLWADMRPSELEELMAPIRAIIAEAELQLIATIIDRVVEVTSRFAAAHPDIPRGHWPNGASASSTDDPP